MLQKLLRSTAFTVLLAAASALVASGVNAQSEQQKLIDAADASLSNFVRDPEMKWLQENLPRAKGVLIALFFMHLRGAGALLRIAAVTGILWLALLFGLSWSDIATR